MEDNQSFCTKCGTILSDGDKFCPSCGNRVPGRSPEQVEAEKNEIRSAMGRRLNWAVGIMLIYSIPLLILGIMILIDIDYMVDAIFNSPTYQSYIEYYGLTEADFHDALQIAGIMYIVSAVCGIGSSILCYKRTSYWIAIVLCLVSMFIGVAGFFVLFMGLFAFWIILTSKGCFSKYADQLDAELDKIQ